MDQARSLGDDLEGSDEAQTERGSFSSLCREATVFRQFGDKAFEIFRMQKRSPRGLRALHSTYGDTPTL